MAIGFKTGKEYDTRMMSRVGTVKASYSIMHRIFGRPTFDANRGDDFDGLETRVWNIRFDDGLLARISDNKAFGQAVPSNPDEVLTWTIHGYSTNARNAVLQVVQGYQRATNKQ